MKLDKRLKRKQKKGREKKFLPALGFIFPFFLSDKMWKFQLFRRMPAVLSMVLCWMLRSAPLRCALLRPTAAKGCTSEYFNCANSSCCTVSELVMCIKPSAERCLLLGGGLFSSISVAPFVIVSAHFLSWGSSGGKPGGYFLCCL